MGCCWNGVPSDELHETESATGQRAASGKTADVSYTPLALQTPPTGGMRSVRGAGTNLALLHMLHQRREQVGLSPGSEFEPSLSSPLLALVAEVDADLR